MTWGRLKRAQLVVRVQRTTNPCGYCRGGEDKGDEEEEGGEGEEDEEEGGDGGEGGEEGGDGEEEEGVDNVTVGGGDML